MLARSMESPQLEDGNWVGDNEVDQEDFINYTLFTFLQNPGVVKDESAHNAGFKRSYDICNKFSYKLVEKDLTFHSFPELANKLSDLVSIVKFPRQPTAFGRCPTCSPQLHHRHKDPVGYEIRVKEKKYQIIECYNLCGGDIWYHLETWPDKRWETLFRPLDEATAPLKHWKNIKMIDTDDELSWLYPNPFDHQLDFNIIPSKLSPGCPYCDAEDAIWGAKTEERGLEIKCGDCYTIWKVHKKLLRQNRFECIECEDQDQIGEKMTQSEFGEFEL